MKRRFASLLRSVLNSLCRSFRIQREPTPPVSGGTPAITPEQFRELFAQMMSDAEIRRLFQRRVALHRPVVGGTGGTQYYLAEFDSSGNATVDSPIYDNGGNVGVGTTGGFTGAAGKLNIAQGDGSTSIAAGNTSGTGRFALNGNSNGSWTAFDYAAGSWTKGITQKSGNVGIGVPGSPPTPINKLDVYGAVAIGTYAGSDTAPTDGLIVSGTVGLGTTDPTFGGAVGARLALSTADGQAGFAVGNSTTPRFAVNGNSNGSYTLFDYAAGGWTKGITQNNGNVGIGTTTPQNKLDVSGGVAVGASYAGTDTAPTNGLIVQGSVGIGTASPQLGLELGASQVFAIDMAAPAGVSATLASGGSLTVGTTYYYVVTAVYASGETVPSSQVSATPTSGNQTVSLSWTPVPGATSYNVYRSTTPGSFPSPSLIGSPTSSPFQDTGLSTSSGSPPTVTTAYVAMIDGGGNAQLSGNASVSGRLGVGSPDPVLSYSMLEVFDNVAIGAYAGVHAAPTDGLIVSGNVGIGTNNPQGPLQVGSALIFLQPLSPVGDDGWAINTAIGNLPSGGGIIYLMPGTYNIETTISINSSGVKLRGYGGAQPALSGTPATQLCWNGTSGGTIISAGPGIQDIEISDLEIDGNSGSAEVGLNIDGVVDSRFKNLAIYDVNGSSGIALQLLVTTTDTLSWNVFESISIYNVYEGVLLDSLARTEDETTANPAHNTFINLNVQKILNNGYGIELGDCDNNSFHTTLTPGPIPGVYAGAGVGVLLHLDVPDGGSESWARSNYFYHLEAGGQYGLVGINASDSYSGPKNFVFGYDLINGEHAPQAYTDDLVTPVDVALTTYFFWVDSNGVAHGVSFSTS